MDHIWAPWRSQYIAESSGPVPVAPGCFLCRALAETPDRDRSNLLVLRGEHASVFLNRYPYNNGHLLVAPNLHRGALTDFEAEALHNPVELMQRCVDVLESLLRPHGFNIGLNLGAAAGAGLPGHLHWHVVPRWNGDTNFMPVLGETKVIVESLEAFYDRFREALLGRG
jgi:ATP adenylyltransferase